MQQQPCSWGTILSSDFADDRLFACLALVDLARLEVAQKVDASWGTASARLACRQQLPHLATEFVVAARPSKRELQTIVSALQHVSVARAASRGVPFLQSLPGLREAKALASIAASAELRAALHRDKTGLAAEVCVGSFRFPEHALQVDAVRGSTKVVARTGPPLFVPMTLGSIQKKVALRLMWQPGSMSLCAWIHGSGIPHTSRHHRRERRQRGQPLRQQQRPAEGVGPAEPAHHIAVDVCAVGSAMTLRLYDARLRTGDPWIKALGLCTVHGSDNKTFCGQSPQALAEGVLCVIYVRETLPASESELAEMPVVQALSLDAPRLRYMPDA